MTSNQQRPLIALVVPSLAQGGGVPAVARFIKETIVQSGRYELMMVSLSTSSRDSSSLNMMRPDTWLRGATVAHGHWDGLPYIHVGAVFGELEFQRYFPRKVLAHVLQECDIVQVVCGAPSWANAVVGLNKPVSLQVATRAKVERRRRDSSPKNLGGWWRRAMTGVTDRLDNRALRLVDAIQLENPWMLEYVKRLNHGRAEVDIRYAPPGVDAARFHPLSLRPLLFNPYILCVGRLDDPRKNIELLLDAFLRLPTILEHVHLVTAGSGAPPREYWTKVEAAGLHGRVRHVHRPETEELVELYQKATVFALSSDEEGLGVVLLEAMACGVPVVATRCGGPDGIITDGKDGFLVPIDDVALMSEKLALLCFDANRNQKMGHEARVTVERRFASDLAGDEFLDVWDQLLHKSKKRRL